MDERIRKKMKTYKHLYEEFISEENIKLAIRNGTKKKRHRPLFNKIDKPTLYDCRQMLSYTGWISATDTYGFYKKYIKPYVNIRYMKKRISKHERRSKLCGKQ